MNGTTLTLGLTAALAAGAVLSRRPAVRRGARNETQQKQQAQRAQQAGGRFVSFKPAPQGFVTDPKPFVKGYALQQAVADMDAPGLYHVTTNLSAVLDAGRLKSRKQLRVQGRKQVGLGGGFRDQAPHLVSVTADFSSAHRVLQAMQMMARAVRGQISAQEAFVQIKRFSSAALDEIDENLDLLFESGNEDDETYVEQVNDDLAKAGSRVLRSCPGPDLYASLSAWEGEVERLRKETRSGYSDEGPLCAASVGFTEPAHEFERVLPENIGLLKLAARAGASMSLVDEECEIRFLPEDLAIVAVWRGER